MRAPQLTALFALASLLIVAPVAAKERVASRDLRRRTLTMDDATVNTLPELHVAGGVATVVTFTVPIEEGGAIAGAAKSLFELAQTGDRTFMLMPKKDLEAPVPVSVNLKDGTVLTFKVMSAPRDFDAQVDVVLAFKTRAPVESVAALKSRIGVLQGDLDSCKTTTGDAGTTKVASLLLAQSLDSPQVFDRRALRRTAKDNRMLLEARWTYRLLGLTYVVLNVENRDPDRNWTLERAEVKVTAGKTATDLVVKTVAAEMPSLPPDAAERVVVAFPTPAGSGSLSVSLTLHEKDGARSATLSGLDL